MLRRCWWLAALALSCGDERVRVGRDRAPTAGADAGAGASGAAQAGAGGSAGGTAGAGGAGAQAGRCGPAGAPVECGADAFCDHDDKACGREAQGGRCLPRPALPVCPAECNPVCACDGKIYCNECVANNAGFDADPGGPCP